MEFLRLFLLPFSLLYGLATRLRNLLFDLKILPSTNFKLPLISVGNLSTGGTGKTPHVEYLINLLSDTYNVSTLSRGYGRKTSGFRLAQPQDHAGTIGDEPAQFYNKFQKLTVAADEKRRNGIKKLLTLRPETDVILLDDAFQHRYVKPGMSVLLTDYHKLYTKDYLLPFGTLRESRKGMKRANIIIITKTPNVLSPFERKSIIDAVKPLPNQAVLFSFVKYGAIRSLWNHEETIEADCHYGVILLVAGIANPYPLEYELKGKCNELTTIRFKDHHKYTSEDIEVIKRNYSDIYTRNKLLVTTEKDAMRMLDPAILEHASQLPFYYIPMEVEFHNGDKQSFHEIILNYVRQNKRER